MTLLTLQLAPTKRISSSLDEPLLSVVAYMRFGSISVNDRLANVGKMVVFQALCALLAECRTLSNGMRSSAVTAIRNLIFSNGANAFVVVDLI